MQHCPACDREIAPSQGHRQQVYCSQACRQRTYRQRQEERRKDALRQYWTSEQIDSSAVLEALFRIGGLKLAEQVYQRLTEPPAYHHWTMLEEHNKPIRQ